MSSSSTNPRPLPTNKWRLNDVLLSLEISAREAEKKITTSQSRRHQINSTTEASATSQQPSNELTLLLHSSFTERAALQAAARLNRPISRHHGRQQDSRQPYFSDVAKLNTQASSTPSQQASKSRRGQEHDHNGVDYYQKWKRQCIEDNQQLRQEALSNLAKIQELRQVYLYGLQTVSKLQDLRHAPDAILPGNLVDPSLLNEMGYGKSDTATANITTEAIPAGTQEEI